MDGLRAAAHDALMQPVTYKGFEFTWPDPPPTSDKWVVNIRSNDPERFTQLGKNQVVHGATLEALERARRFIDNLREGV
jgi:hypothetical protein